MSGGRLSEQEESTYTDFFSQADTDKDGCLSQGELASLCCSLGFKLEEKDVKKLFNILDTDGNKQISLQEFLKRMPKMEPEKRNCANLRRIFQTVDKDGNGFVTPEELFDVIKSCGRPYQMSMLKGVVDKLDKSGDGKLNYEEFLKMYTLI